jgi:hypothetical protein
MQPIMRIFKILILVVFTTTANAQPISSWLFGQNHWMDRSEEGRRPGYLYMMWPKVEESGIKMVRIGGIGYENNFPSREKLTAIIDSIRGIGAEPFLQVPRHFSEKEAAQLVKNYKYSKGKGIRFYCIGNEPMCNNKGVIDDVHKYIIRLAPAMKAADPKIKILVFDECTFYREPYEALCGGRLDITGKDKKGNWIIDGFSFHNYPNGQNFNRDNVVFSGPQSIRRQAQQLLEMIDNANKKHGRDGDNKLLWGLTEVNVTYINPDREISGIGNPSFLGGQFIAEIYGIGLEYGAFTVAPWCIVETDRVRTDFGYLGLPSEFYPRSSYYHTQMMALNMKGEFLPSESTISYVKSICSKSDDEICVMVMNKDQTKDFEFDLLLNNKARSDKPLSVRADAGIDKVITGSLPNQTTVMFVLSKTGEVLKQYTYGLTHNLRNQPPEMK